MKRPTFLKLKKFYTAHPMVRALLILKEQLTDIGGLIETILFQKDLSHEVNLNLKEKNVFVIHTTFLMHWVVLTNINYGVEDKWLVLDNYDDDYLKSANLNNSTLYIAYNFKKPSRSMYSQ